MTIFCPLDLKEIYIYTYIYEVKHEVMNWLAVQDVVRWREGGRKKFRAG